MPEGPEVKVMSEGLHRLLCSKLLLRIEVGEHSRWKKTGLPQYSELEPHLPLKIISVTSRGKKILIELEHEMFLIVSLGMEGKFVLKPRKHSDLWLDFRSSDGVEFRLYFDDTRHFGRLDLVLNREELTTRFLRLGPDVLQDNITSDLWKSLVRNSRIQNQPIGCFLLDQKRVSSIGNYLRAEILYRARIRPDRSLKDLSDEELETLRQEMIETVFEAYRARGCTLRTYEDLEGKKGMFRCRVYQQKKDPAGHPVVKTTLRDGRTMYWVPEIQK